MKTHWPLLVAAAATLALLVLYQLGWYRSAWVLTIGMICFPVLYTVPAIIWLELSKRRDGSSASGARQHEPQQVSAAGGAPAPPDNLLGLACPHCGLQAMSLWRKWGLVAYGWNKPVNCRVCRQLVEVRSFSVMAWTLPFIFFCVLSSMLMAARWMPYMLALKVLAGWLAIGLAGLVFGIHLRKRGPTDPEVVQSARAAHLSRRR